MNIILKVLVSEVRKRGKKLSILGLNRKETVLLVLVEDKIINIEHSWASTEKYD